MPGRVGRTSAFRSRNTSARSSSIRATRMSCTSTRKAGGTFRSRDGGGNWEKMNDYFAPGAQYYAEIWVDPNNDDRLYSADVWVRVSDDGGKTWRKITETTKHPDSHLVWIDPANS